MTIDEKLGETIQKERMQSGIDQISFAFQCGISKSHYGRLERGENSMTIKTFHLVSKELGVSMSDLLKSIGY